MQVLKSSENVRLKTSQFSTTHDNGAHLSLQKRVNTILIQHGLTIIH